MMEWILAKLALSVGEKWAKPLFYAILAALAVAAFFGAKAAYDHAVEARHDAKVEKHNAVIIKKADTHEAAATAKDEARLNQEADQLERIANAKVDAQSVAANRRAFRNCVRRQQSARQHGEPTPGCVAGLSRP